MSHLSWRFPGIVAAALASSILAGCSAGSTATPEAASPSSVASTPPTSSPPIAVTLLAPEGVAVGQDGRVYVSDFDGNHIFRLESDGSLTVVAGNGLSGFSDDGTSALEARLGEPAGIAFSPARDLYFMDHHNHRVREVDAAGNIVTVAGSGPIGQGQGSFAGDGGPAAEARLAESIGIAFDGAGNLYIADNFNHRIRRVDTGGVITTFAGNGAPSGIVPIEDGSLASEVPLANPWYLTFDAAGNLVFSDVGLGGVFRIGTDGRISRVPADVRNPNGVGFDAAGNLYIADADNQRIVKVGADGTVTTIAGTGTAGFSGDGGPGTDAEINTPFGLAVDRAGNVYFADGLNRRLRMIDTAGVITTIAGG